MRRINASFNSCRLIRFDIAVRTPFNPPGLWVAFNPLGSSHKQPVTARGASCRKPATMGAGCASLRWGTWRGAERSGEYFAGTRQAGRKRTFRWPIAFLQDHHDLRPVLTDYRHSARNRRANGAFYARWQEDRRGRRRESDCRIRDYIDDRGGAWRIRDRGAFH